MRNVLTFWINGKQVLGPVILEAKRLLVQVREFLFPDYPNGKVGLRGLQIIRCSLITLPSPPAMIFQISVGYP